MRSTDTDTDTITEARPRAETVRARRAPRATRTQFNTQEIDRASREASARRPVVTRPVTTRTTNVVVPTQRRYQATTAARKQPYTISLSTPGAEIRLPAFTGIQFGWRLLSGLLTLAMAAGAFLLWNSEQFQFQQAQVVGAQRLTADDIEGALRISGLPVIEASPAQMETDLLVAFPDLQEVSVSVGLPASLTVNVVERTPALVWQQGEKEQWIDAQGFAFPVRGLVAPAATPEPPPADGQESQPAAETAPAEAVQAVALVTVQASGNPPAPAAAVPTGDVTSDTAAAARPAEAAKPAAFIDPKMVAALQELGKQAPEGTPILYSPEYGLGWQDPEGWQVFFGHETGDMAVKLEQYRAIVENLKNQGVRPSMISVAFSHAPFYRLEQ